MLYAEIASIEEQHVTQYEQDELASAFRAARAQEERHVELCRRWLSSEVQLEARAELGKAA